MKMNMDQSTDYLLRGQLAELLTGGFAPVVTLLREFDDEKAGIILQGLPFSAYSLLEHMRHRQHILLQFMKNPMDHLDVWPDAYWPENPEPENKEEWNRSIDNFEKELEEMIDLVHHRDTLLFEVHENGKTISWAAMTNFHHNAYTIGQIKAIGRQLDVW